MTNNFWSLKFIINETFHCSDRNPTQNPSPFIDVIWSL